MEERIEITKSNSVLYVYMLGGFRMVYDEKTLTLGKSINGKMLHLLMLILYAGNEGIHRRQLLEMLYSDVDSDSATNSLRAMIFRLRKSLAASGLPGGEYIVAKGGVYRWNMDFIDLELDVDLFRKKADLAMKEEAKARRIRLLEEACRMYVGEFLPTMIGDDWVSNANWKYQDLYFKCIRELIPMLEADERYTELLSYCDQVLSKYPYEEWHIARMRCMMAMKDYRKALDYYEGLVKKNQQDYRIQPSVEMRAVYREIKNNIQNEITSIEDVSLYLQPNGEGRGASSCDYLTFMEIYGYVVWVLKRYGVNACIAMFTILDEAGVPMESSDLLDEIRDNLDTAIGASIRRADLYTRYGKNQFLLLMVGTEKEGCDIAAERICDKYRELCRKKRADIYFTCQTAWEVSDRVLRKNLNKNMNEFR